MQTHHTHSQGAAEAVRRKAFFPFPIPIAIPEDVQKHLG